MLYRTKMLRGIALMACAAVCGSLAGYTLQGGKTTRAAKANGVYHYRLALSPGFPPDFPAPTLNGNIPLEIPKHDTSLSPIDSRPYFDSFSWQSFIALNWPVTPGQRGVPLQPDNPKVFRDAKPGTHTVWGSYKEAYELFGQGSKRPTPWESFAIPKPAVNAPPGAKVLTMLTKGDTFQTDITQAFSFPLIDQHNQFVSYEVRFNKTQYNFIRGTEDTSTQLYLLKSQVAKKPIQMPASAAPDTQGALMLKAAWRVMTPADDLKRFYTRSAMVYDLKQRKFVRQEVGLVGLHIVQKLEGFPEWIWSSFEQIDNVPNDPLPAGIKPAPYSFNNGTADPPAALNGFANKPKYRSQHKAPPIDKRVPVQVIRFNSIPNLPKGASTQDINRLYQKALAGTVWQYYQLVVTQWPSNPKNFKSFELDRGIYPKDSGGAFPQNGAVNTCMETYFQSPTMAAGAGGNSCMSCHYRTGLTDFSWSLARRAH